MVNPSDYSLWDLTVTPMSYRDRITVEFALNGASWLLNLLLFLFIRFQKEIWNSLKSTIVFVTTGSLLINIPLLSFQFWMVINLQLGREPSYSIFVCSLFKNFCSSTTSTYQVLPFAVSLYRYRTVVLKAHPSHLFVVCVHLVVATIFVFYALLNYPFGVNSKNDVCYILRFSNEMELIRIFSTLLFNIFAIVINCIMLRFVQHFESESKNIQSKRVQLTQSLLIQSAVPVLVSLPLLLGSFQFYFGMPLPSSIGTHWYAMTFLGPFLMPLSSILGIKSTRRRLFNIVLCGLHPKLRNGNKSSVITFVNRKTEISTFNVRDDD